MELHVHPDSAWKRSLKTCKKLTSAECRVVSANVKTGSIVLVVVVVVVVVVAAVFIHKIL